MFSHWFAARALREVTKAEWGHESRALSQQYWCPYKKRKRPELCLSAWVHRGKVTWGHSEKWPSASQKERSHQTPPWHLDLGLLASGTVRKKHLCCLSNPVFGIAWHQANTSDNCVHSRCCVIITAILLQNCSSCKNSNPLSTIPPHPFPAPGNHHSNSLSLWTWPL